MKIVQLASGFDVFNNGGVTNYVRSLSNSLAAQGCDVIVIDSQKGANSDSLFRRHKLEPTQLRPFHRKNILTNSDEEKLVNFVKSESPQIIHVHMMLDFPPHSLLQLQEIAPMIITLHDYSWFCHRITYQTRQGGVCSGCEAGVRCGKCVGLLDSSEFAGKPITGPLIRRFGWLFPSFGSQARFSLMKTVFRNSAALIAVSNRVREIYQSNGFTNSKFLVNHIGNYTAATEYQTLLAERGQKRIKDPPTLGFLGSFSKHKGAELVIQIARNIPNKVIVYGSIEKKYQGRIKAIKNIDFRGRYSQVDLANITNEIDVGIVSSIWEDNAPQVVFEFLNSGVPVFGTRIGGIPDFVRDMENGILFDPNSEGVEKIIEFMRSPEAGMRIYEMSNSIKRTKSPEQHMREILQLYEELGL